jgi:hypothetical protein
MVNSSQKVINLLCSDPSQKSRTIAAKALKLHFLNAKTQKTNLFLIQGQKNRYCVSRYKNRINHLVYSILILEWPSASSMSSNILKGIFFF